MTEAVPLDGHTLTLDKFLAIVRGGRTVSLEPSAIEAVEIARRAVERAIRSGRPIYGVTTGFGFFSDRVIPPADARQLQLRLVRSHASGLGPPLSEELVRGLMLHRLNSLANGHSGVRREVLDRLTDLLNRRLVPFIPEQGSVGASGDLAPLAHLALAMIGEGSFVDPEGRRSPARDRLTQEGLDPLTLEAKEGVSILNGTSLMASYLALSVSDAHELLEAAIVAAAVSFDALEGDPT
ncbi:MAG: aromatic amino acid lyase, partial [Thermoplasmata archaeon]